MKHLSVLIKPASSLCNLRCKYCFYANISSLREVKSHGIMKREVTEKMIDNIFLDLDDGDHMTFAFQGGEPTVAGLSYFRHFVDYVFQQPKRIKIHYAIQTNGTMLNEEWAQFLKEHNFLVGLSIDGCPKFHNLYRLDTRKRGTYNRVSKAKKLLEAYDVEFNVLSVLTNDLAQEPDAVFEYILEEDIRYIQFIPCLDDLDAEEPSEFALQPENFASFYNRLYELWRQELAKGNYISIQLIDNIVSLIGGRGIGMCGMLGNCGIQYVIEADGSVYPCDFYVLDEYRMGYITESTLFELRRTRPVTNFLCNKPELSEYCQTCPFIKMCNGGCKRMKNSMYLNKAETFCGYREFLTQYFVDMRELVWKL